MPFTIIRNDITKLDCDAIVNAANNRLACGGGVCGAIFSAAGAKKLQDACDRIGFCETGKAVITDGFDLKAKYIIHTVGPIYGKNPALEEKQLYSCYKSSLVLAKEKRLSSVAFPLISSGIYGYPKDEALTIATSAIKDFLAENDMDVFLVIYDSDSFAISKERFARIKSYIDEKTAVFPAPRTRSEPELLLEKDYCEGAAENFDTHICIKEKKHPLFSSKSAPCEKASVFASSKNRSLEDLISRKTETFSQMLLRLIDEKGMTDVEVYKRANIDRKLFSKIRKKDYTPKKATVIALIIALRLNMDEAKDLLCRAGFAFSECARFDIIISYFIENGIYDIFEINEALFAFDEQLLGA